MAVANQYEVGRYDVTLDFASTSQRLWLLDVTGSSSSSKFSACDVNEASG